MSKPGDEPREVFFKWPSLSVLSVSDVPDKSGWDICVHGIVLSLEDILKMA